MLMERELNKGGKTDEKIQSIDGNAARGNRSVGRGGGKCVVLRFFISKF